MAAIPLVNLNECVLSTRLRNCDDLRAASLEVALMKRERLANPFYQSLPEQRTTDRRRLASFGAMTGGRGGFDIVPNKRASPRLRTAL